MAARRVTPNIPAPVRPGITLPRGTQGAMHVAEAVGRTGIASETSRALYAWSVMIVSLVNSTAKSSERGRTRTAGCFNAAAAIEPMISGSANHVAHLHHVPPRLHTPAPLSGDSAWQHLMIRRRQTQQSATAWQETGRGGHHVKIKWVDWDVAVSGQR